MRSHLLSAFAIFLFALGQATSAERTWTGGGGAGMTDWSSPLNWGGTAPVAGDALTFPNVTNKTASNGTYAANTPFGPLTINAGGYVLSGASIINLQGGIFLNGANSAQVVMPIELETPVAFTVSHASGVLTLPQPLSGTGGVVKSGPGTLILNGNNSYSGGTLIEGGGLLQVGNNIDGPVRISNGYLIGTGTVDGIVSLNQVTARVSPGTNSAAGTLTSNGDVTFFSNDALYFTIGATSDKLVVNGEVNLGLAAIVPEIVSAPALNTDVVLIQNDGTDLIIDDAAVPSNYLYSLAGLPDYRLILVGGVDHNDLVLRRVATVVSGVNLNSSNLSVTHGTSVTFTATVTGGNANGGTVSFWDGNEFLGSNTVNVATAQISTSALKPGSRKITAMFEGDSDLAPSRSAIISQTVTGTDTSTGLVVSPSGSSASNALVTMTATVTGGSPTGTVTFSDQGVELGTEPVASNQAVFTTTTLVAGAHQLTATYNPTGAFEPSTSNTVLHTVNGTATSASLSSSGTPVVAGTDVTFTATISGGPTTGSVAFRDGTVILGTADVNGSSVATFTTSGLSAGTHSMTVRFLGTTTHEPSLWSTVFSQVITAAPDGSGSSGGNDVEVSGGCGLGSGTAALMFGLLLLVGLRLRRD